MSARAPARRPQRQAPARGTARSPAARVRPPARTRSPGLTTRIGAQVGQGVRRAFAALPVAPETWRRLRNWSLGLLLLAGFAAGIVAMGLPQMAGLAAAHALGQAGFVVRNVEIDGRTHVDRDAVYRVVMDARGQDMPLVDLEGIRRALLGLGWVADARVSRRLPDTLVVDIVERAPAAVWQYQGRLALIDGEGHEIAPVDGYGVPDRLPLLIGPNANAHAAELTALIAGQPSLKPLIRGGTWIGDRRWDLRFVSGEVLALPEGDAAAARALAWFARKDSESRLLGQGIVRFDLRDPTHMVVRMSSEPGARLDQPPPAPPVAPPPATTSTPAAPPVAAVPVTPVPVAPTTTGTIL